MGELLLDWARNILFFMVFLSVISHLLADASYEKYIRFFAGIVLILITVSPLKGGLDFQEKAGRFFEEFPFFQEKEQAGKALSKADQERMGAFLAEYKKEAEARIRETGQAVLDGNSRKHKVELLTVIGEIEGHESAPSHSKTTKYEHVLPKLALIEDDEEIEGLLILLNTVGGDVEAGLAIAEMIASLSIPTVSLVLGGGHSIGVPMAVSADYSFIVPSATMVVHPVRQNGMFIGVAQSYRNMEKIQDRIIAFVSGHSHITAERMEELMLDTSQLVKDVGTMLEGEEAVKEGLIDEVGGIREALDRLYTLIERKKTQK